MEYYHNPGKALEIEVAGERYLRHGIRTHFVEVGEDYLDLFRRYVVPVYRPGDWVAVSEKVAALCQGRVIHRQEIQVTWLARLLAKCVRQTPAGPGMGLPVKMQFALDQEGRARVLWAALRAGVGQAPRDSWDLLPSAGAGGPGTGWVLWGGHPRLCGFGHPHSCGAGPAV